jgi:hypothetical protein
MSETREPTESEVRHREDTEKNEVIADDETADPTTGEDAPQSDDDDGGAQTSGMSVVPNPDLEAHEPRGSQVRHDDEHGWGAKEPE